MRYPDPAADCVNSAAAGSTACSASAACSSVPLAARPACWPVAGQFSIARPRSAVNASKGLLALHACALTVTIYYVVFNKVFNKAAAMLLFINLVN